MKFSTSSYLVGAVAAASFSTCSQGAAEAFAPSSHDLSSLHSTRNSHRSTRSVSARKLAENNFISGRQNENPLSSSATMPTIFEPHIVILGGGFGGINTALSLPSLPWANNDDCIIRPKITLIDKSERFVFLPLLYELCVEDASLEEVAPTFASLLEGSGTSRDGGNNERGGLSLLPRGLPVLTDLMRSFQTLSSRNDEELGKDKEKQVEIEEVTFVRGQVEGIDVNNQQVVVSTLGERKEGEINTIDYDALVISTGGEISLDAIPGASKYALPFYTVDQCFELKRRLSLFDNYLDEKMKKATDASKESVVVVGGGYSGVELALNLVDRLNASSQSKDVEVTLVHRGKQVLQYATEHNRKSGLDRLKGAGVNVMTSTSVEEVLPWEGEDRISGSLTSNALNKKKCIVKLSSSTETETNEKGETFSIPATLLLWTAGATPTSEKNTGIRNSILPRDVMGRILTSPTLNVKEHPNIFAIGDCSRPKKVPYAATAQVAMQQATVASWNVYATLTNKYIPTSSNHPNPVELLPFNFINLGEMMTLGSNDATISSLNGLVEIGGPAASWLRRWIYAVRMPTARQGLTAALDGTGRKMARSLVDRGLNRKYDSSTVGETKRRGKPVDWK
ncbi:hypothetical protein ACHAXS_003502 [Conticribra weissflogii]